MVLGGFTIRKFWETRGWEFDASLACHVYFWSSHGMIFGPSLSWRSSSLHGGNRAQTCPSKVNDTARLSEVTDVRQTKSTRSTNKRWKTSDKYSGASMVAAINSMSSAWLTIEEKKTAQEERKLALFGRFFNMRASSTILWRLLWADTKTVLYFQYFSFFLHLMRRRSSVFNNLLFSCTSLHYVQRFRLLTVICHSR